MSETLRQFLESRGLQLVRQKVAGGRSRVWIPRACNGYTITFPANFGEDEHGNISGLVPFEEVYDINSPPPAPTVSEPRWLGKPMVDEQTLGPLTLYHDEKRERRFVRVGDAITGQLVTFGVTDDIDAKTRAWLAPLAEVIDGLRVTAVTR